MSPPVALCGCLLFIFWLLRQDGKARPSLSSKLWLALFWLTIEASRPVSAWLALGGHSELQSMADGNSVDRNVSLLLIIAGLFVLQSRNLSWRAVMSNNAAFALLYLFLALSIAWSDFPFVSLKRWFKDFGNVVIALVILTEKSPDEAIRAVFVRCGYVLIPLSVLFLKYYTALGRGYSLSTGQIQYHGVAMGKNMLGASVLVLSLSLFWEVVQQLRNRQGVAKVAPPLFVLCMGIYVLFMANSATAIACTAIGALGLFATTLRFVRKRLQNLFAYSICCGLLLVLLSSVVDIQAIIAQMLGRDPTLTGRDKIWELVLAEKTNPFIGTGFDSFWMGMRSEELSQKNSYGFRLNQAHNGYLELYLNGGAIGLSLLIAALLAAASKIRQQLAENPEAAAVKLVFWVIAVMYNWTEAAFFKPSPIWFVLLVVVWTLPARERRTAVTEQEFILPEAKLPSYS